MEEPSEKPKQDTDCEVLFVNAAPHEHIDEYLEAIYLLEEKKSPYIRVSSISKRLNVSPPSVVEMLKKLESLGYLEYSSRQGIRLLDKGREVGRRMVRNGRLIEVLMHEKFKIAIDPRISCGMEHHMTEAFTNGLCTLLGHPTKCPHGNDIPKGSCCS